MKSHISLLNGIIALLGLLFITSCEKKFSYAGLEDKALETLDVDQLSSSSATISARINSDRGSTVTVRGICWSSTIVDPTVSNSQMAAGSGTGYFGATIVNLSANTTYYVRAYATNNFGTAYGNTLTFKTKNVTVGQSYQGGTVAYILATGDAGYVAGQTHGLIVQNGTISNGSQWGCSGVSIGGTSVSLGSGEPNTIAITAACTSSSIAAGICKSLVSGGYSDWNLPSRDELIKMYQNRTLIGGFSNVSYWSSSQSSSTTAWSTSFSSGVSTSTSSKTSSFYVKAIRYF